MNLQKAEYLTNVKNMCKLKSIYNQHCVTKVHTVTQWFQSLHENELGEKIELKEWMHNRKR
jgi:hypothetical protein